MRARARVHGAHCGLDESWILPEWRGQLMVAPADELWLCVGMPHAIKPDRTDRRGAAAIEPRVRGLTRRSCLRMWT